MTRPSAKMTVEQVETIFGEPNLVHPASNSIPIESRGYTNDCKHCVIVEFKNGRVFEISESTRDMRLINVGVLTEESRKDYGACE